jgi:hypothetical protein
MSEFSFEEAARQAAGRRPESNYGGVFECQVCREQVTEAHLDAETRRLRYWCSDNHESFIKDWPVFG